MRQQLLRHQQEEGADEGGDAHADARSDLHALNRALRVAGAEILPGNRGRRSHQADRGPGDERKELGVANRIGRLRLGAVGQRSDEAQQHDAGDIHRDALDSCRQSELEERPDDRQVRPARHRLGKVDDQAAAEQQPDANRRDDKARRYRADRCATRAERRHRPEARDQDDVERDVQHRHQDPEAQAVCAHHRPIAAPRRA